jgi:hypothetical protein
MATFALTSKIMSLAARNFDLEPLVPCFRESAFAEDIDVVEAGEAVDAGEVICR